MKNFVLLGLVLFSFSVAAQRVKSIHDSQSDLSINVIDVAEGKDLGAFTVRIVSTQIDSTFFIEGQSHQNFVLDMDGVYKIIVKVDGFDSLEYEWKYSKKENNFRILFAHFYPKGMSQKEKDKALKKYYRCKKKEPQKTCRGLHWENEVTI